MKMFKIEVGNADYEMSSMILILVCKVYTCYPRVVKNWKAVNSAG